MSFDLGSFRKRMEGAVASLKSDFGGLRTGRANVALLDNIMVDAYGAKTPINQVAAISVPEPRMLTVNVWDKSVIGAVERALRESPLGINPVVDGQMMRIPMPPLTEERRKDLTKIAGGFAENARVAIRNVRRDAMDTLKKLEKDSEISEDEHKKHSSDVQKATDDIIGMVDEALRAKSEEIMQVQTAVSLMSKFQTYHVPAHIGIIMDGNGRWAKARHRPRVFGHQEGVKTVRRIVDDAADMGCLLYTSPSPRDQRGSRMPSSA